MAGHDRQVFPVLLATFSALAICWSMPRRVRRARSARWKIVWSRRLSAGPAGQGWTNPRPSGICASGSMTLGRRWWAWAPTRSRARTRSRALLRLGSRRCRRHILSHQPGALGQERSCSRITGGGCGGVHIVSDRRSNALHLDGRIRVVKLLTGLTPTPLKRSEQPILGTGTRRNDYLCGFPGPVPLLQEHAPVHHFRRGRKLSKPLGIYCDRFVLEHLGEPGFNARSVERRRLLTPVQLRLSPFKQLIVTLQQPISARCRQCQRNVPVVAYEFRDYLGRRPRPPPSSGIRMRGHTATSKGDAAR